MYDSYKIDSSSQEITNIFLYTFSSRLDLRQEVIMVIQKFTVVSDAETEPMIRCCFFDLITLPHKVISNRLQQSFINENFIFVQLRRMTKLKA